MGRRRRVRDDLIDLALEAVRAAGDKPDRENPTTPEAIARAKAAADRELAREQSRQDRRARQRAESQRSFVALGSAFVVGGLVFTTGVFPLVAVGAAFLTAGAVSWSLRKIAENSAQPRLPDRVKPRAEIAAPRVDEAGLNDARAQLVRKVIDDATVDLKKLDAAAGRIADPEAAESARRLVNAGQRLSAQVAAQPEKLAMAQRAFTYHLPKAVYLAESISALEAAGKDPARLTAARHVLARMENLFEKTALDLAGVDAREMDVELRLIQEALDEDLNERRR